MGLDHGRSDTAVAQQFLNGPDVLVGDQQMCFQPLDGPLFHKDNRQSGMLPATMEIGSARYKIFGMVTNISETDMNEEEIIHWLHARCGKSEEVHSIIKPTLLAGPCKVQNLEETLPGGGS